MLNVVTGPLGNGKSLYAARAIAEALEAGRMVATNIEPRPGWADLVARHNTARRLLPGRVDRRADEFSRQLVYEEHAPDLFRYRLPPGREGRGLMVVDEGSDRWLNARNWNAKDREAVIRFFSRSRKLGWDVLLVVQDLEMVDRQVRALMEHHIRLKNLRRWKPWPMVPLVLPVPVFIASWTWQGTGDDHISKREVFRLGWFKDLYRTEQLPAELDDDERAIVLPLAEADPRARAPRSGDRTRLRLRRRAVSVEASSPDDPAGWLPGVAHLLPAPPTDTHTLPSIADLTLAGAVRTDDEAHHPMSHETTRAGVLGRPSQQSSAGWGVDATAGP